VDKPTWGGLDQKEGVFPYVSIPLPPSDYWTNYSTVVFAGVVSDNSTDAMAKIEVQVATTSEAFTSTNILSAKSAVGDSSSGGSDYTVSLSGIPDDVYHWRMRAVDDDMNYSDWVVFGGNSDGDPNGTTPVSADIDFGVDVAGGSGGGNVNPGPGGGGSGNGSGSGGCGGAVAQLPFRGLPWALLAMGMLFLGLRRRIL
jgi:hypothetical protein